MKNKKELLRKDGKVYTGRRVYSVESYRKFRKYQDAYSKRKYRRFNIKFNRELESNLIEFVESHDNVTDYIKQLVIADIKAREEKSSKSLGENVC